MRPSALVTGATNRLGRAIATHLAERGFNIWLHCKKRNDETLRLQQQLQTDDNFVEILEADLLQPDQITQTFESVRAEGNLALLINSASVFEKSRLDQADVDMWETLMNVNLRAAWLCAKEAAIVMQSRKDRALIVNIADSAAYQHWTEYGIYGLSKSALLELTLLLAKTYAPKIRVNSISPGLILKDKNTGDTSWNALIQKTLLQSSGSPDDIIGAIDFLWENSFITGIDIPVDGGYRWKR